ncbi:hypothetical protein [Jannaschia aquimarina]|uniref:Uncharacterized protein n=1 Tax=Jannaschia aquimarina TaxID=935700 RepID=A0A0D1EGU5_9RHOB|nr:hypothetical protein [Jannaschia aquimarina]KIT16824.1 hypothetical protein jaqu_13200 [Jannaschia aquimarina]SNT13509.1 hypothetical protein SAMN05421775_106127 [Jannaschia aquimarina]
MVIWRRYLDWRARTARPPVALGVRAARLGALACCIAIAILAVPVWQGHRIAERGGPLPTGTDSWSELQRLGMEMAQ